MKLGHLSLIVYLSLAGSLFAYETPTDAQLQKVLTHPQGIERLLKGASCTEAAATIAAVLEKLSDQNLSDGERINFLALLVARATHAFPDKVQLTNDLIDLVNDDWSEIVAAAAYTATGLDEDFKTALSDTEPDAMDDPMGILGEPLYRLILRGGAFQSIQALNLPLPPPPAMGTILQSLPRGKGDLPTKMRLVRSKFPTASLPSIKLLCLLSESDLNRYLDLPKERRNRALDALRDGDVGTAIQIIRGGGPPGGGYQS
ncbi:MAG: hypothetical protein ACI9TH_005070 [Kiritimatiellia bacterium]|jgi:hypothetical protein